MPQVTPTDFDIAEYPSGSPSNSSVEVKMSWTVESVQQSYKDHMLADINLFAIFPLNNEFVLEHHKIPLTRLEAKQFSNWPHRVSNKLPPRIVASSGEKSLKYRIPDVIRSLSASLGNLHFSLIAATRELEERMIRNVGFILSSRAYLSLVLGAPMTRFVISAHVMPGFSHSFSSASSQPASANALMNAGLPLYLSDPLTTVSASGIL